MSAAGGQRPGPIVSAEAAPLKSLTVAMTVMCYLGCLALGALILIDRAVETWTGSLKREVTAQIRPVSGADVDAEVAKAEALIAATPGILAHELLDRDASADLLEPWLGSIRNIAELPIPRLIAVTVDPKAPPDLDALDQALKGAVKGASLDAHRHWQAELTRMASVLERLGLAVLLLICTSAVAIVVFATRTVLDANRGTVEVLHLIGARNGFIARQIEGRFLRTGLVAGLLGLMIGLATFLILGLAGPWSGAGGVADASRALLFSSIDIAWQTYATLLAVPAIATLISLITARMTLMRMLREGV